MLELSEGEVAMLDFLFHHENTKTGKHEIIFFIFRVFTLSCFRDEIIFIFLIPVRSPLGGAPGPPAVHRSTHPWDRRRTRNCRIGFF